MDRSEFQQDSVLKQLEVLKEEEKEFQNLKVIDYSRGGEHVALEMVLDSSFPSVWTQCPELMGVVVRTTSVRPQGLLSWATGYLLLYSCRQQCHLGVNRSRDSLVTCI